MNLELDNWSEGPWEFGPEDENGRFHIEITWKGEKGRIGKDFYWYWIKNRPQKNWWGLSA